MSYAHNKRQKAKQHFKNAYGRWYAEFKKYCQERRSQLHPNIFMGTAADLPILRAMGKGK